MPNILPPTFAWHLFSWVWIATTMYISPYLSIRFLLPTTGYRFDLITYELNNNNTQQDFHDEGT